MQKINWTSNSHEAWLSQRRGVEGFGDVTNARFGASDVGTITGTNSYKCPNRLFLHTIGRHSSDWITETSVAGHLAEPIIATVWESWEQEKETALRNIQNGVKLRKTKKAEFFLLDDNYPQLFASIDRLHDGETFSPFTGNKYAELTPIEFKTTKSTYYKLWEDGITPSYYDQVQAQMMLSGTEVAVFCVWVDGAHFYVREVEFDKERAEFIDYKTREFQQICIAGKQIMDIISNPESHEQFDEYTAMLDDIAPESTHLDDEQALSRELFPESNGLVKGDEKDFQFLLDYNEAHESIKLLEDSKQLAKNNILALMKDAEVLEFNDGKVTWRRADGKRDYFQIKINK